MTLFRDHPVRSVATVAMVLFAAHVGSLFISMFHMFHFAQLSLVILTVSGLMYLIALHHKRDGDLLTQTQEEALLIFCFGIFWMSAILGWRALRGQEGNATFMGSSGRDDGGSVADFRAARQPAGMQGSGQAWPYPCSINDAYCVVDEYTFF